MNFCNCVEGRPAKTTNKFRIVDTNKDGLCMNCGYYTLSSIKKMNYIRSKENKKDTNINIKIRELLSSEHKGIYIAKKLGVKEYYISRVKNNII